MAVIRNLQALRALAAWMVVAHHMRGPLGEVWGPWGETLIFASGVDVFFVLSGYVMVASTADRRVSAVDFLRRRVVRIAPLYWAVTGVIVLMLLVGMNPVGVNSWEWRDIAQSVLFLGLERSDGYPGPLLGVGWTLAYEVFFYLLFGLSLLVSGRTVWAVLLLILALVGAGAVMHPSSFVVQFYTAPILLEFAAGALIAKLTLGRYGLPLLAAGLVGIFIGAMALSQLAFAGDLVTPGGDGAMWRTICFGAPAAFVVAGAVTLERSGVICRNPTVLDQGDASYALYLIHLPLIQLVEKAIGQGVAVLLIATPLLAVLAHFIHQKWERPVMTILSPRRFSLRAYRLAG